MTEKDSEQARIEQRGMGKVQEKKPGPTEDQRDTSESTQHMPRHWQSPGTRGQSPGQPVPGPDEREPSPGNQYGRAGDLATDHLERELTEHGREAPPQRRDNDQLPKRPGERNDDLPTPAKPPERP